MSADRVFAAPPQFRIDLPLRHLGGLIFLTAASSCGTGSGGVETVIDPKEVSSVATKPDGSGDYLVDQHFAGQADAVYLKELYWGRLVDVWSEDPESLVADLVYRDLVIGDGILSQFGKWRLEDSPLSGRTRLVIERANTPEPEDAFDELVAEAQQSVGPVLEKSTGVGESPPFSFVPRNAALVLPFSDLIDEGTVSLGDSLRVLVGNPPELAYEARIFPSPNHGGLAAGTGEFHSTRLIVDFTIDSTELALLEDPLELNGLGLPATTDPLQANLAIEIPTAESPGSGSFDLLRNLAGQPLADQGNGPVDVSSPSMSVVRAMRTGYEADPENGFLADNLPPSLIGSQSVNVSSAVVDPSGEPGRDFIVSMAFETLECGFAPIPGDVLRAGGLSFDVTQQAAVSQGVVSGLRVQLPQGTADSAQVGNLVGQGLIRTRWRSELPDQQAPCFVRFSPEPNSPPSAGVLPGSQIIVEFSEPMDPESVRPFDTFVASRVEDQPAADDYVVARVLSDSDLRSFRLVPLVGFDHEQGTAETYYLSLSSNSDDPVALRDLAGNRLTAELPSLPFGIQATAPDNRVGGWALPFNDQDEIIPKVDPNQDNGNDLAGQVFYDTDRQEIFPRQVTRFPAVADRTGRLVGPMTPVATGLQTPLSNLGSKMQILWRYSDFGFPVSLNDGTFVNLDVEGLSLSPLGGTVTQTFYPQFEMRLGHSSRLPDELLNPQLLPTYPQSGFFGGTSFAENYLSDPDHPPKVVHQREDGFFVGQTGVFQSNTGTVMLRYPMNLHAAPGEEVTYTWRDTAITSRGGFTAQGTAGVLPGLPHPQEQFLALGNGNVVANMSFLYNGATGGIPSVGLPLLMEFSCYPSEAVSLNNFDASTATGANSLPAFRAFSTGGFNTSGNPVIKNPDSESSPSGGFNGNPLLGPLGTPTLPRDPTVYIGQLDVVVRVSRVYTTLIEANVDHPDYAGSVQEPSPEDQPSGTKIEFAFRGNDVSNTPDADYFDSANLDLYGNSITEATGTGSIGLTEAEWSSSIDSIDSLRWAQVRMSFLGNLETGLTPRLSALGVAYRQ